MECESTSLAAQLAAEDSKYAVIASPEAIKAKEESLLCTDAKMADDSNNTTFFAYVQKPRRDLEGVTHLALDEVYLHHETTISALIWWITRAKEVSGLQITDYATKKAKYDLRRAKLSFTVIGSVSDTTMQGVQRIISRAA